MWLFRGAQSAIFYYAACTPCVSSRHRRRRRRNVARTQREAPRDMIVSEQPSVFHQPFPFSTNAYWSEEIALGPGPPAKRGGNKNHAGRTGSQLSMSSPEQTIARPSASPEIVAGPLDNGGPVDRGKERSRSQLGDRWNWIRYQREDEELWGPPVKGSSVGLSGRGRAGTNDSTCYIARNPEVNDLHPPVACGPKTKAETRWMIQPPPSARIMEGKVGANTPGENSRQPSFRKDTCARRRDICCPPGEDRSEEASFSSRQGSPNRPKARGQDVTPPSLHSNQRTRPRSNRRRPPSIVISNDNPTSYPQPVPDEQSSSIGRPPLYTLQSSSHLLPGSKPLTRDDTHLTLFPSLNTRSNSPSPTRPLPGSPKPHTRNDTNPTQSPKDPMDSGKAFHLIPSPPIPTPWHHHDEATGKYVRSIHFEITPEESDDERSSDGTMSPSRDRSRQYRWSMDI